jgi:hypothetical protein
MTVERFQNWWLQVHLDCRTFPSFFVLFHPSKPSKQNEKINTDNLLQT